MTRSKLLPEQISPIGALTVDQLEEGLLAMDEGAAGLRTFWDRNVTAFRRTLCSAIKETSDALLSQTLPPRLRVQLQAQLEALSQQVALADRYIENRSRVRGRLGQTLGLPGLDPGARTIRQQCRGMSGDNQLLVRRKHPDWEPG
jgi:hypothetical protein